MIQEYSIVIRTLGSGGVKYRHLLNSINSQTIPPKHIYVVLPFGYSLPNEQLGNEEFIYAPKGMWSQRIFGLEHSSHNGNELILACDDDISFSKTFMAEMLSKFYQYKADILIPSLGEFKIDKIPLKERLICLLMGTRRESKQSPFYIRIGLTAGHIINRFIEQEVVPTQSGNGACFLVSPQSVLKNSYLDELWLDSNNYALPEDQVFHYKSYLRGDNVMFCKSPYVNHLDSGSTNPDRKKNAAFSNAKNFLIFWHRFLWRPSHSWMKFKYLLGISYRILMNCMLYTIYSILHSQNLIIYYMRGIINGIKYLKSNEYRKLAGVRTRE